MIARWPGHIPAGRVCHEPAMNIDWFPTCLALAGIAPPADRVIDGCNILPLLTGEKEQSPHDRLYFYHNYELEAMRMGDWKYIPNINTGVWPMPMDKHWKSASSRQKPFLYNLRDRSHGELQHARRPRRYRGADGYRVPGVGCGDEDQSGRMEALACQDKPFTTTSPDWTDNHRFPGSYRAIVKEGRPDQIKVPGRHYYEQLKRDLKLDDEFFKGPKQDGNRPLENIPPSNIEPWVVERLIRSWGRRTSSATTTTG
jgi:hypothetical protein